MSFYPADLAFDDRGLIPVIVQDVVDGRVLMLAYANAEAVDLTLSTGFAHFYSRSRDEIWKKGATSGNVMRVDSMAVDCDADTLLYLVEPTGPACHTGKTSCFWRPLVGSGRSATAPIMVEIAEVIGERSARPRDNSYVSALLAGPLESALRKIGEEASEVMLAGALDRKNMVAEVADLWFHSLVALKACGQDHRELLEELLRRRS